MRDRMSSLLRPHSIPLVVVAVFLGVFLWGLNQAYPLVGHDFSYFFPRLLAGKWHFLAQGFSPFRYAAHLCGGFPVYGNPHDVFYSLTQLLSLFADLWTAVQLSIVVALIAGYIGWFRFGRDILRLSPQWSHALSLIIIANGYYFMHMIVGHLSYHTLPLAGWFLWFLFDHRKETLSLLIIRSAAVALLGAYVLFAAGYFVLLLTGLTALLLLPIDLLNGTEPVRSRLLQLGKRLGTQGIAFLLLCSGKLVAIVSLMRFFPRSTVFDTFAEGTSGLFFIIKSFFVLPQGTYLFSDGIDKWGIHEYSMFLSPLVLIGCVFALRQWGLARKTMKPVRFWLMALYALLLIVFFAELSTGHGILVDWLGHMPIFSSLRVTVRFLYVPALLLSMAAVVGLSRLSIRRPSLIVPVTGAVTILSFLVAYVPLLNEASLLLTLPYDQVQKQIQESSYLNQSVNTVRLLPEAMPSDLQAVLSASTSPGCYEPLLKDSTLRKPLTEGLTATVTHGFYNITNPACLQYPDENNCAPGDLIAETDSDNFQRFTNGLPVTWQTSTLQRIADAVSVLTLIAAVLLCIWPFMGSSVRSFFHPDTASASRAVRVHLSDRVVQLAERLRAFLFRESKENSNTFALFLSSTLCLIGLGFVVYVSAFKLLDRDFWWHITAGKVIVQTWSLIQMEPFSYTREGMPYLANHEWLAQIVLYLLYATGGSTAIILFRTVVMAVVITFPLLLWRRALWVTVPLGMLATNALRPSFIERPQLFTFIIFSAFTSLTMWILQQGGLTALSRRVQIRLLVLAAALQILWVNVHGGAAFIALLFPGILFVDAAWQWWRGPVTGRPMQQRALQYAVILGFVLITALFVSPITYQNVTYLWNLLTDRTIIYIEEWKPRPFGHYLPLIGPYWLIAASAIALGKKYILPSTLLVLITGYLSRDAMRHEPLFVIAVLAVTVLQLRASDEKTQWTRYALLRPALTLLSVFVILLGLGAYTYAQYASFVKKDQLAGYGTFEFGKDAVDFLEREKISGKMFNAYGIGGYLIHRGYPDPARKVFIDGRNVDYGFALMNQTYLAGIDPVQWQKLADTHGFTYAVVDYFSNKDQKKNVLNYSQVLDGNPDWPMVYFDDWVAVYLKKTPENAPLIDRLQYRVINASNMEFKYVLDEVPQTASGSLAFEKELKRAIADSPESIKARITLAKLFIRQNRLDEAHVIAQDAAIVAPNSPEPHAMFAAVFITQKQWVKAADELEIALDLADNDYPEIDYGLVAQVFAQAGRLNKARIYARRAGLTITGTDSSLPSPSAVEGTGATIDQGGKQNAEAPMVNPASDALEFHDKALAFAQAGKNAEARENFLIALKLNPSFATAWNNLGTLSFFENKLDEAKTQYERAVEADPEYADAHFNLALLLIKTGKISDAREHMQRAKELGKDIASLEQMTQ